MKAKRSRLAEIRLRVVPHVCQKYDTVGNWREVTEQGQRVQLIEVSALGRQEYEALVAVHELIEWLLCRQHGVSQARVDRFDLKYEAERRAGKHGPDDEPGDDKRAPYFREHQFASKVERMLAKELRVRWGAYEASFDALPDHPSATP